MKYFKITPIINPIYEDLNNDEYIILAGHSLTMNKGDYNINRQDTYRKKFS